LDEIPFKMWFYIYLAINALYIFKGKNHYHIKENEILWSLHYFFNFCLFGNVSWTINMKHFGHWKNVSYIFYVHYFYPISSSNHWIKNNFDVKWTLSFKMLSCKILSLFIMFQIVKGCHQDLSLLHTMYSLYITFFGESDSPSMCFHPFFLYAQYKLITWLINFIIFHQNVLKLINYLCQNVYDFKNITWHVKMFMIFL
jgi:hypothetical protein